MQSAETTTDEKGSIRIEGLRKEFDDVVAVDGIDLEVRPGEFFTILGPSGCGKTTTLRMITGLETPSGGSVHISGKDVTRLPANKRDTSIIFQEWALFPHMSVAENISFGLEMDGVPRAEREDQVREVLELVELAGYEDRPVSDLSGGQKQRIAMARSVVLEPDVLLLDEPLASLDRALGERLQVELKNIQDELGITFVYVTHDQEEALTMSDRIAVMNEGQVQQVGPVTELYEHPTNTFVAEFLGETNLFEGTARTENDRVRMECDGIELDLAAAAEDERVAQDGGTRAYTVRPEETGITGADRDETWDNQWTGVVENTIYKGSTTLYEVDIGSRIVKVQQQRSKNISRYDEGKHVVVGFDSDDGEFITG